MEYRGVEATVEPGPILWRWRVWLGEPPMLRVGYAESEEKAVAEAKAAIDRAASAQEMLANRRNKPEQNDEP